jgi:phosphatidylglycerophosphate synthase
MKLHRINGKPEWEPVSPQRQNSWQHVAANTRGIVTAGNALTVLGFGIALVALVAILQKNYGLGVLGLFVGRMLDIADGYVADKTRTKSPLGELLDASIDKLITALTLLVFLIAGITPWPVLLVLLIPHLIITIMAFIANARGARLHPSRYGKLSMAFIWFGLAGLLIAKALHGLSGDTFMGLGYLCLVASVVLGIVAIYGYRRQAKKQSGH